MSGMSPVPTGTPITQEFGSYPGGFNPAGGHTGRDYGAWTGTFAVARTAGTVLWADWCHNLPGGPYGWALRWFFDLAFGGIIVVIEHDDGIITTYSHMWSTHLNPGDRVGKGEIVGETGNTGAATTGDHLHFEAMPRHPDYSSGTYGRIHPGPFVTEPYTTITTSTGTRPAVVPDSGGSGATTTPPGPWEEWETMSESERNAERNRWLQSSEAQFLIGRAVADAFLRPDTRDRVGSAVLGHNGPLAGLGLERGKRTNLATQNAWNFDRSEKIRRQVVAQSDEQKAQRALLEQIAAALNIPTDEGA